ncbi:SusD/RagB family nutrient-binding outer membrane lipoprotein [Flavitalea flava]
MKRFPKIALLLLIPGILITGSCSKTFFTDVNNNPNVLPTVPPKLLLPTVEAALGYTQGGDISRFSALLMQQMFGANSQSQQYYIYNLNPGVFDNLWPDLFTSTLENDYTLMKISDAGGYNAYGGISRIILAYTLQMSVDLWGDLPYSQAFKGNAAIPIFHPTYDKAKDLYDTVSALIDAGTVLLQNADPGLLIPGNDDVIYGGNADNWIKFGHAIKARLAIHQSKGDPAMATKALTEIAQSFTENSHSAVYTFGPTQTSANSWYQFYRDRPGDENFESSPFAIQLLAANDPRYTAFDMDGTDNTGVATSYYNKISSPTELITYEELLFVSAEATLRNGGGIPAAETLLKAAITANMTKLGVGQSEIGAYITANATLPGSVDAAIATVSAEEFKALFLNPEAWVLWRRTGSPNLTTTAPPNAIPRRLLYPQTELNFNLVNVPTNVTLNSPLLFWDK